MAQAYNNSGAGSGYGDQPEWPTSTAMARNTSHESDYSNSSEFSNGQYDVALSPSSEGLSNYDFLSTPDGGTYAGDDLSYEMNSPAGESGFQYQFYNFIASGDSGQAPYWQLKPNYTPTTDYPAMIPVEPTPEVPRAANDTSGRHVCLEPFCSASPFRRKADLQRHYLHRHRDATQKKPFPCDWKKCQRSKEPFYRLDHCREHYRDFHMEDLMRRGSNKENTQDWWLNRNVDNKWWRCAKCLSRILIDNKGFECPKCKIQCEPERRKLRGYA
ncbi:hypothetical protein F4821DRAFT_158053 [Hypoxylon rubiginosum]|uniref:Uncharacterized protein n=1 Tax=Hypoxylon rubiginosum TaxID=110542 RepID=A0ACC0DHI3_9PEZI|nr:hypothetical protein F4821DRAFT_158053 [Hypoxylon rubiginosum]